MTNRKKWIFMMVTILVVVCALALFCACDSNDSTTPQPDTPKPDPDPTPSPEPEIVYQPLSIESSVAYDPELNHSDVSDKAYFSFTPKYTSKYKLSLNMLPVDEVLGENGVKVEKVASDDAEYTEKYSITITYVDEESGEKSTRSLSLYVKLSAGAEIEGKTNYTFDAKVMWVGADGKEVEVAAFSGEANFDKAKDAMIFTLGAKAGDEENVGAFANIKAYATAQGTVKIEMGAGAGVSEIAGANAALSVEIGKFADGKYGAIVTAQGDASVNKIPVVGNVGVKFVATVNVYANSQENAGEFALNGSVEATVTVNDVTYKGTASLTGKAVYDADKDEAVVGLNGVINFTKVQEENK